MNDVCFLIFTNDETDKEISIGLNNDDTTIKNERGTLMYDREKILKGRKYIIRDEKYTFIGFECKKIPTNTLPNEYKRARTVMPSRPVHSRKQTPYRENSSPPKNYSLKKSPMKTKSYNKSPIKPRTPNKNMTEKFNTIENAFKLFRQNWNNTKKIKK